MSKARVLYHAHCLDGLVGAWCFYLAQQQSGKLHDFDFVPVSYDRPPPEDDEASRKVLYLVDFSYTPDVVFALCRRYREVIMIDHHKTAIERFRDLPAAPANLTLVFDMEKSGARLAYEYCGHPACSESGILTGEVVTFVEDRDLWRFDFKLTRAITRAMAHMTSASVQEFAAWICQQNTLRMSDLGGLMLEDDERRIASLLERAVLVPFMGYDEVPCVNVPAWLTSETLNRLAESSPCGFALGYGITKNGVACSLRAIPTGPDVSLIAQELGGGGHRSAAGFRAPIKFLYDMLDGIDR